MFEYTHDTDLTSPPGDVWNFLTDVKNLLRVMPPKPRMEITDAPDRLTLGSRFTIVVRQWCFRQAIVSEVIRFDEGRSFTDVQVAGPFERWEHTHSVEPIPGGTRMRDHIVIAPPAGLAGYAFNERRIRKSLDSTFAHRDRKFRELLSG